MNNIYLNKNSKVLVNGETLKELVSGCLRFTIRRGLESFVLSLVFVRHASDPIHEIIDDLGEVDIVVYPDGSKLDSGYNLSAIVRENNALDERIYNAILTPGPNRFFKI